MKKAKVSILMPVKNTSGFLEECLISILNQTYKDWELIAVDDHSEDNSYSILRSYALEDSRITVIKNTGSGIIDALRMAFTKSSGQFITRMDSDDLMEQNKIDLLHKQLQLKGKGNLAVGLVNYFSNNKLGEGYLNYANWLNGLTKSESNFSDIYKECSIPSPCWMVNRIDFNACGGFDSEVYPEDYDLAFRFRKAGFKITAIKKVIHQWRDYETRTSRTDKNYSDNRFSELKVMHFLDQDIDSSLPLILWGAGTKGKKIASLLLNKEVQFQWVCNNPNKIGREIYGTYLMNLSGLDDLSRSQVIVAVSSPHESVEIENGISANPQHQYFRFF